MEKVRESSNGVIVSTDIRHIRPNPSWQHRGQSPTLREGSDSFFFFAFLCFLQRTIHTVQLPSNGLSLMLM